MIRSHTAGVARRLLFVSMCAVLTFAAASARAADAFALSSPGLADGGTLDSSHAASANNCGGGNVSPALQWRNTPAGTKSYAITIFDPDGAKGLGIVHWVLYGVAPSTTGLGAGGDAGRQRGRHEPDGWPWLLRTLPAGWGHPASLCCAGLCARSSRRTHCRQD